MSDAKAWHRLYNTKAWQQRRKAQLDAFPLCRFCEALGRVTSASVADHVVKHSGDETSFFEGDLQSLCKPCHDGAKQSEEKLGWSGACDLDGYPLDQRHPNHESKRP